MEGGWIAGRDSYAFALEERDIEVPGRWWWKIEVDMLSIGLVELPADDEFECV